MLFEIKPISEVHHFNETQVFNQLKPKSIKKDGTPRKNAKKYSREESKKTRELSIREKLFLIDYSQTHTVRETAKEFNVGLGTVVNIKKRKAEYIKLENEEKLSFTRKRKFKQSPYDELNKLCWTWFSKSRNMNIPLSGPIIQETARKFAAEMKLPGFKGSNGWLLSFTKAHNINLKVVTGTEGVANYDTGIKFLNHLKSICKEYQPQDIFNLDETSLCWRALPERSWLETQKHNGKLLREKVVVLLAVSIAGERLRPLVVGRTQCGKGINMQKLQVDYHCNPTAWMTCDTFQEWLLVTNEVFLKQNRKVLFFLHNSPQHPFIDLSNITLCFLPSNPPFLQPLNYGIIKYFKTSYRKFLLRHLVASTNLRINSTVTTLDMLLWLRKAWQEVPSDVIQNSFSQSGFSVLPEATSTKTLLDAETEVNELIGQAHTLFLLKDKLSAEEYHQVDQACDELLSQQGEMYNEVLNQASDDEIEPSCIDHHIAMLHVKELKQFSVRNDVDLLDDVLNIEKKLQDSIVRSQHFSLNDFFY